MAFLGRLQQPVEGIDQLRNIGKPLFDKAQIVAQVLIGRVDFVGNSGGQVADGFQPLAAGQFALHPFPFGNFNLQLLVDSAHGVVALFDAQCGTHAGREDLLSERLGNVIVGAGVEARTTSSSAVLAVTRITGMLRSWGSAFSRLQTSIPSISGIMTSSSIASGRSDQANASASLPLPAVKTSCPSVLRCTGGDHDEIRNVVDNQYLAHAGTSSASLTDRVRTIAAVRSAQPILVQVLHVDKRGSDGEAQVCRVGHGIRHVDRREDPEGRLGREGGGVMKNGRVHDGVRGPPEGQEIAAHVGVRHAETGAFDFPERRPCALREEAQTCVTRSGRCSARMNSPMSCSSPAR